MGFYIQVAYRAFVLQAVEQAHRDWLNSAVSIISHKSMISTLTVSFCDFSKKDNNLKEEFIFSF